jgi:radical SAM superfamily enzyme YgiQ (UPF0313 family)
MAYTPATTTFHILSALTPASYEIRMVNQRFFWRASDFVGGCLVGISCATPNVTEAYRLADRFRQAGSTVVLGGVHASYMPEEAAAHADSVVVGEAESVWPQLLRDYEAGSLQKVYRGVSLDDYFSLSCPYFLTRVPAAFLCRAGLILSRGCKYRCEFCAWQFGKLRFIKPEQALALVAKITRSVKRPFGFRVPIVFRDDNIFSDPDYARALFEKLAPFKIQWFANSSLDIAFDEEALRLARASGCRELFIGFETIHPATLAKTSVHGIRSSEDYIGAIRRIKSYGIRVIGAFILGFDDYTHRDYLRLALFLLRSGLFQVSMTILTPFPGSALHKRLGEEGRILTRDWSKYDSLFHVVFRPKRTSAFGLQAWFYALRFYSMLITPAYWVAVIRTLAPFLLSYYIFSFLFSWT